MSDARHTPYGGWPIWAFIFGGLVAFTIVALNPPDCPPCERGHYAHYDQVDDLDPLRPCGCPATGAHYYECTDNQ